MWFDRTRCTGSARRAIPTRAVRGAAAAAALCAIAFFATGAARADPVAISKAETLLFMTPHLRDLLPPSRLHYAFRKSGTLEQGFSDTVDIDVIGEPDGSKKGVAHFFSGKRQINYPEVEHAEGNPVLLWYLEREIREMSRLTGGKANHFRQRIRAALADSARIADVDIRVNGQTMRAQQITISPYDSDPNRDRFQRLATKRYEFTICDAIPGLVYQMRGVVPAASGSAKDEAVIDETLTFKSAGTPR
jgi:hypothetical protein